MAAVSWTRVEAERARYLRARSVSEVVALLAGSAREAGLTGAGMDALRAVWRAAAAVEGAGGVVDGPCEWAALLTEWARRVGPLDGDLADEARYVLAAWDPRV